MKKTEHGHFHRSWYDMIRRCTDKNNVSYKNYGGRGIKVQESWFDFWEFSRDMLHIYLVHCSKHGKNNTTLDRIDVEGNYTKNNCRYATRSMQSKNRRKVLLKKHAAKCPNSACNNEWLSNRATPRYCPKCKIARDRFI